MTKTVQSEHSTHAHDWFNVLVVRFNITHNQSQRQATDVSDSDVEQQSLRNFNKSVNHMDSLSNALQLNLENYQQYTKYFIFLSCVLVLISQFCNNNEFEFNYPVFCTTCILFVIVLTQLLLGLLLVYRSQSRLFSCYDHKTLLEFLHYNNAVTITTNIRYLLQCFSIHLITFTIIISIFCLLLVYTLFVLLLNHHASISYIFTIAFLFTIYLISVYIYFHILAKIVIYISQTYASRYNYNYNYNYQDDKYYKSDILNNCFYKRCIILAFMIDNQVTQCKHWLVKHIISPQYRQKKNINQLSLKQIMEGIRDTVANQTVNVIVACFGCSCLCCIVYVALRFLFFLLYAYGLYHSRF